MASEQSKRADMETLVSLCKRRGFVFQSSEIYGGLGSTWDYGPLGVELKRNIKEAWWRSMVWDRDDVVGLDAAILMNPQVWVASGHAEGFTDPLVECKACNSRFRADHIVVEWVYGVKGDQQEFLGMITEISPEFETSGLTPKAVSLLEKRGYSSRHGRVDRKNLSELSSSNDVPCPSCDEKGRFTEQRLFNLMFETHVGPLQDSASRVWLRPETAQGIFVNFENVQNATRRKAPFGIAQIGKAFRNEITVGNFVFRTREFEQMEMEFFVRPPEYVKPGEMTDEEWHKHWVDTRYRWYLDMGIRPENLRVREHERSELAHYAKATSDIEYSFPWGWDELEGVANRTDFDLRTHEEQSGKSLKYFDQDANTHYHPYVIEPSCGVDRCALALLADAYTEEMAPTATEGKLEKRVVMKLHRSLAPVKVAVLPLSRNEKLVPLARDVYDLARGHGWLVQYDDAQSIGRRYRRQDEAGTPICVTVDFDSLDDRAVTIRDRDTMAQDRVPMEALVKELEKRLV